MPVTNITTDVWAQVYIGGSSTFNQEVSITSGSALISLGSPDPAGTVIASSSFDDKVLYVPAGTSVYARLNGGSLATVSVGTYGGGTAAGYELFNQAAAAAGVAGVVPVYLGFVATGCHAPNNVVANNRSVKGYTYHFARDEISALQIEDANWYANFAAGAPYEFGTGAALVVRRWVEYPVGSNAWQQVTWSGAPSISIADGANSGLSDNLVLATRIPRGAMFRLAYQIEHPNGAPTLNFPNQSYTSGGNANVALLNRQWHGSTTAGAFSAENPTAWAVSGSSIQSSYPPAAIVGTTTRPSIAFYGCSRDFGSGESTNDAGTTITTDGDTDHGQLCKTLGKHFAYGNYAMSGDKLQNFVTSGQGSKRAYYSKYASHIGCYDVTNDFTAGRTTAQMTVDMASFQALFSGKKFIVPTVSPVTTSTGDWITGTQTTHANNAIRVDWNRLLRAGRIPGMQVVFDVAAIHESSLDSGIWGTWNSKARTYDGTHNSYNGYQAGFQPSLIDPGRLFA